MRKPLKYIVLFLLIIALLSGANLKKTSLKIYSENGGDILLTENKLEDFEYMFNIIKENYPFIEANKRIYGIDWVKNKDKYIKKIESTKNEEEFFYAMNDILSDLHNDHTVMISKENYIYLKRNYENLAKKDKKYEMWVRELDREATVNRYLSNTKDINNYEINKNNQLNDINIETDFIKDKNIAYIKINSFMPYSIEEDISIIKIFLETIKEYEGLIIDIRGNSGGDIEYWQKEIVSRIIKKPITYVNYIAYKDGEYQHDFIDNYNRLKKISKLDKKDLNNAPDELYTEFKLFKKEEKKIKPKDSIKYDGDIFLLVDGEVYSSAEMFASFCKVTGFATVIGEITGGDGIGSDPVICSLPNSGYIFTFSQEMGMTEDGKCNYEFRTSPDYLVNAKVEDLYENDDAIQKVIEIMGK